MAHADLAYEIVPVRVDNRTVSHAKASCRGCKAVLQVSLATSMPPEHVAKKIRQKGWEFDLRNPGRTICPACQADAVARRYKTSPKEKIEMTNVTPISAVIREPTHEERAHVRALLDGNFDDSKGIYLEGYSDKRVGDEAKVPMVVVQRIRDAAYGPLRQVPEIDLLKVEIADIKEAIGAFEGLCASARTDLDKVQKRIAELEAKLGIAA